MGVDFGNLYGRNTVGHTGHTYPIRCDVLALYMDSHYSPNNDIGMANQRIALHSNNRVRFTFKLDRRFGHTR